MKDLINQKETTLKSQVNEKELLAKLSSVLDTKIDREELEIKAEKPQLQKMYRMLKVKIDELN